ncbi:MAG: hypothetical protein AB1555_08215 [Nitrospirota bacterium]
MFWHTSLRTAPVLLCLAVSAFIAWGLTDGSQASAASASKTGKKAKPSGRPSPPVAAAQRYAEALAKGDRVTVGRLDFACSYTMVKAAGGKLKTFPAESDPVYETCWKQITDAHTPAIDTSDQGMDLLWPSKGDFVFFGEELNRYPASAFVMDKLGLSPPGSGLRVEPQGTAPLPAASFRVLPDGPVLGAPATLVKLTVTYQDPLTSPVTYAPGTYKWANTIKRPRRALKSLVVQWVVMSGLGKHGFPSDLAVLNLPVATLGDGTEGVQEAIPFVTETSGAVRDSLVWWGPKDAPGLLIAAVGRAALFPDLRDRVAMLNRVLIIDPNQPEALTVLTRDLYAMLLREGAAAHQVPVRDGALADRVSELYWNTYAQTTRTDLSLGMEMGGFDKPTAADYLYRVIPAMEKLARVRPEVTENRLRLGIAYRWNNDQLAAIQTHEALLKDVPPERAALRARVLIELAWSRIEKVAWNRFYDDPEIQQAYREAGEALKLADQPLDKFTAAYTMAYSMLFMPNRDHDAMLNHLTEARRWYEQIPGASQEVWHYWLGQELLKAVLDADPKFKPLLAAS